MQILESIHHSTMAISRYMSSSYFYPSPLFYISNVQEKQKWAARSFAECLYMHLYRSISLWRIIIRSHSLRAIQILEWMYITKGLYQSWTNNHHI